MTSQENYRIDHLFSLMAGGEYEELRLFCTPDEADLIEKTLIAAMPDVEIIVEAGSSYDYSTEEDDAVNIAASILANTGFLSEDEE